MKNRTRTKVDPAAADSYYLNKKEAAQLFRVSPRTINNLMKKGVLRPSRIIPGRILFRRADCISAADDLIAKG
jgi:hypothetical protein